MPRNCPRVGSPCGNQVSVSGGGGIRTHGTRQGPAVFKTAPFDRSGTPPASNLRALLAGSQVLLVRYPKADEGAPVKKRTKRGLVVGGAALAIVGGGGAAVAARGDLFGDNERQAFLDDAAKQLNVSPTELQNALQKAFETRIDAAVKAGTITKEQGAALKARAKANGGLALPFFGFGRGPGRVGAGTRPGLGAGPGARVQARLPRHARRGGDVPRPHRGAAPRAARD